MNKIKNFVVTHPLIVANVAAAVAFAGAYVAFNHLNKDTISE